MKKEIQIRLWGRILIIPVLGIRIIVVSMAVIALIVGFVIKNNRRENIEVISLSTPLSETPVPDVKPSSNMEIWVYVVGEVVNPGIYPLESGSLISYAIEAAGGFTENSDRESINLVGILQENTMIKVPAKGEEKSENLIISENNNHSSSGKININTANVELLCTLSGIGESTASKIINYREENGPFAVIEDIMKVPGIKEAKFLSIKENICVE